MVALALIFYPWGVVEGASTWISGDTDLTSTLKMDNKQEEWEAIVRKLTVQREKRITEAKKAAVEKVQPTRIVVAAPVIKIQPVTSNSYSKGNCTWYVASKRPVPGNWGNAKNWLASAKASGWTTGKQPVVGAIAWTGVGPLGHVAYVEAIQLGMVRISEMNYAGLNIISSRWVPVGLFTYIY